MANQATPPNFLACIPHAIEPYWDDVWASRLAGFPVNLSMLQGSRGLVWPKQRIFSIRAHLFNPSSPGRCGIGRAIDSDFSVLVKLHKKVELTHSSIAGQS